MIAETDALGRVTRYAYTPLGWLQQVTGPDGTTQRYTYDPVGNVLSEQDGNGHITRYEYDLGDRLLRKTDPLGRTWHYRYDPMGNLTDLTTPSNEHIAHTYDALNRLTRKTYDGALATAYAYDANGNRVVMTDTLGVAAYEYDALNRLTRSGDANGRWVQTHYDALGQKVRLTYPDGAQAQYLYDSDGNLSQVTAPDGGITAYDYDALGRPVRVIQANGVTVATVYDAVGNTRDITQSAADGTIFSHIAYTLDAADRKAQTVEATFPLTGAATVVTTTYTYDDLDRLTASLSSDGRETHYAFDRAGNRTALWGARFRDAVLESYRVDYAYNAANQLLHAVDSALGTTTYAYDANGNRIMERAADRWADYSYDAEGHLTDAHIKVWANGQWGYRDGIYEAYHYDGDGRRVRKETVSVALGNPILRRDYRYDDTGSGWDVLQTYDVAGTTDEARYLYDGDLHKLAYWQNGTFGYFQNDGLGSILGVTGETGAAPESLMRYGDYGELLAEAEALPTDDAFTGYEYDVYTGMYYARNRTYDPATGTFLSVDPYPPDRTDLLDLHRYLYTQANPTNMTDPLGLWGVFKWLNKAVETVKSVARQILNSVKQKDQEFGWRKATRYSAMRALIVARSMRSAHSISKVMTENAIKLAERKPCKWQAIVLSSVQAFNQKKLKIGSDNGCGGVAVGVVAWAYGIGGKLPKVKTLEDLINGIRKGANCPKSSCYMYKLVESFNALAEAAKLSVKAKHEQKLSFENIKGELLSGKPVVVLVGGNHFVTLTGYSLLGVQIMNPSGGKKYYMSEKKFVSWWSVTSRDVTKKRQAITFSEPLN